MTRTEDYFREFVTITFIQKNVILGIVAIFVLAAILIAFFWPPVYSAAGSIIIKRTQPLTSPGSLEDVRAEVSQLNEGDLFSEMQILQSRSVSERAARRFLQKHGKLGGGELDAVKIARLADEIEKKASTELVPLSNVIRVSLAWKDRDSAREILGFFFDEYLRYRSDLYNPQEAQMFFQQQISNFVNALDQREKELIAMAESGNVFAPDDQIRSNLLIKENLEKDLALLRQEYSRKKNYLEHIESSLDARDINFFTSVDNMEIGDLGKRLQQLFMDKQEMRKTYAADSNKIKHFDEEIQTVYESLRSEVQSYLEIQKADVDAMESNLEELDAKLLDLEKRNIQLYTSMVRNNRLDREINLLEDSYATFAKRLEEAEINSTTKADTFFNVGVLSKPQAANAPVFPKKSRIIPLGLILGLIVGITVGFVIEFFDHRFKRPEDIMHYAELPHLFSIARW